MAMAPMWAKVARIQKTPAFLETECAVNLEQYITPKRLPPSSSRHSAFIPLPSGYTHGWAMDIISNLPSATVGVVPRADIALLEVCFATEEAQQDFLSTKFSCKHFDACPVPPVGTSSQYVPVKLVNVPLLSVVVIEQQLRSLWCQYGEVVAIAPHTYKGTPLLSNRWDMVVKLNKAGTPLSGTPFFDLLGFKVMASWPGSDKACPRCKAVGHDSQSCPRQPAVKKARKHTRKPSPPPTHPVTSSSSPTTKPLSLSHSSSAAPLAAAERDGMEIDENTNSPSLPNTPSNPPPPETPSSSAKAKLTRAQRRSRKKRLKSPSPHT
jgi:hypothetical protein